MKRHFSIPLLERAAELYLEFGSTPKAARAAGVSERTMRYRIREIRLNHAHLLAGAHQRAVDAIQTTQAEEAQKPDRFELEIRRRDQRIADLTSRLKKTEEIVLAVEDERDQFRTLKNVNLPVINWTSRKKVIASSEMVPIVFTSDFQFGEVIKASELDGMNAYNKDIFAERYETLITKSIDLAFNHTGASGFPGVFYLRGGDAISGNIHEELSDTNDLSAIPACRELLAHEREGIKRLRDAFGRVHVISIPGNHGRTTLKSRAKSYVDFSYETMLSWWLASSFEDDTRVTFQTPDSGDAFFNVLGWNFLLSHGDRMGSRGGAGFVGPSATIARGHMKLMQNWMLSGHKIDYVLTGHLHTSLKLPGSFANGSLAGYNEYAQVIRANPDSAKQWLLCVSEEYGPAQNFEVILSPRPNRIIH